MTRIAVTIVAAVLLAAAAPVAHAQQGGGRGGQMTAERMRATLFKDITLSADQQASVDRLMNKYQPQLTKARDEMMAARRSGQPMPPETMQRMRTLQTEQRDSLRTVLTAEQQAQFDRNIAAMSQGRGMRGGRPPRG